jgi:DNA mismatch endonuclease (patch repair protein)
MQAVPRVHTKPEVALRAALYGLGLRFRINVPLLPGLRRRADIVFRSVKVACFVHGCFWHGCPSHLCWPARNPAYWRDKIEGNRARDADTTRRLRRAGWAVVVCWEHEAPGRAAARIARLVRSRSGLAGAL